MTHNQVAELLPAYALDALSQEEVRAVEDHVRGCQECQRDLAAFTTVTAAMADSVVMTTPPPALRARVLEAVRPEVGVVVARPVPQRARGLSFGWALGLAAAAAAVVVAVGAVGVILNQRLADLQTQLARQTEQLNTLSIRVTQQEQLLAIVTNPALKRATLAGSVVGDVQFVYDPASRLGALIVRNLVDPGQGRVYQLWLVAAAGAPQSAGVFRPVTGRSLVVPITADFTRYRAIAISVEQGPSGAPLPTAPPILSAIL